MLALAAYRVYRLRFVRRIKAIASVALISCVAASAALADQPGTDGGGGKRFCDVLTGVSSFGPVGVGVTKMRCRKALRVARQSVQNDPPPRWRCTGVGTRFGHCHRGRKIAHWYAYH